MFFLQVRARASINRYILHISAQGEFRLAISLLAKLAHRKAKAIPEGSDPSNVNPKEMDDYSQPRSNQYQLLVAVEFFWIKF